MTAWKHSQGLTFSRASRRFLTHTALLWCGASLGSALAAPAATVLFVQGDARQQTAASQQPLKKGDAIEAGATLVIGAGKLQVRFIDGALMSFMPNTRFLVAAYQAPGNAQQSGKAEMQLLEGGLRTVTGAVSKFNKEGYKLETPTGTLGIRGTEFVATVDGVNTLLGATVFVRSGETPQRDIPAGRSLSSQTEQSQVVVNRPAIDEPFADRRAGISTARQVNAAIPLGSNIEVDTTAVVKTTQTTSSYPLTAQATSNNTQLVGESAALQQVTQFLDGGVTQTFTAANAPPVLNQVTGTFDSSGVAVSATYTGTSASLLGSDGLSIQWGQWLGVNQTNASATAPALNSSVSPTVYWLTGTALSNVPTSGVLTFNSIGQAGSMKLDNQAVSSVTQVASNFVLNMGTATAVLNMTLQGGTTQASFTGVPVGFDAAANTLRLTPTAGTLTVNGAGSFSSPQLMGLAKLYGNQASHAGMSYQVKPGATDANSLNAWGVVAYKR